MYSRFKLSTASTMVNPGVSAMERRHHDVGVEWTAKLRLMDV